MELDRCVAEIKMKDRFKDGRGLGHKGWWKGTIITFLWMKLGSIWGRGGEAGTQCKLFCLQVKSRIMAGRTSLWDVSFRLGAQMQLVVQHQPVIHKRLPFSMLAFPQPDRGAFLCMAVKGVWPKALYQRKSPTGNLSLWWQRNGVSLRLDPAHQRVFPCCLARKDVAWDVDEVLWPDRTQRRDAEAEWTPRLYHTHTWRRVFYSFSGNTKHVDY